MISEIHDLICDSDGGAHADFDPSGPGGVDLDDSQDSEVSSDGESQMDVDAE